VTLLGRKEEPVKMGMIRSPELRRRGGPDFLSAALWRRGRRKRQGGIRSLGSDAIAAAWAPIVYQDVDATGSHGLNGKADFITAVEFDGD
jgi:hypothetical protein